MVIYVMRERREAIRAIHAAIHMIDVGETEIAKELLAEALGKLSQREAKEDKEERTIS